MPGQGVARLVFPEHAPEHHAERPDQAQFLGGLASGLSLGQQFELRQGACTQLGEGESGADGEVGAELVDTDAGCISAAIRSSRAARRRSHCAKKSALS